MANLISVRNLTKRYGDLIAVDGVSFSVREGEIFGILGPNGAGKTTTLDCIEGLAAADSGSVSVLGMDISRDAAAIKRRIGVQLQASAYFDYLTLREILQLFARVYGCRPSIDGLLSGVGLLERADSTVAKLSGGQGQRFTLAAAVVNDPDLVFLDEPTAGLDPQARRGLWDFVRALNRRGRGVVMTTHYIEEAEALCDRVAIMDKGRIVALDAPAALIGALPSPHRVMVGFDGAADMEALRALGGVTDIAQAADGGAVELRTSNPAATVSALTAWAAQSGANLTRLDMRTATLEDAFLALTGRGMDGMDGMGDGG